MNSRRRMVLAVMRCGWCRGTACRAPTGFPTTHSIPLHHDDYARFAPRPDNQSGQGRSCRGGSPSEPEKTLPLRENNPMKQGNKPLQRAEMVLERVKHILKREEMALRQEKVIL
ncbi:hypothetical protein [Candidatus Electrothrix sp.]|uniref:hypothetical protein n=1 Tax=Candidatus Electrothrix sp. TaxID=2170559 RepID=UPI004056A3DF